MRTYLYIFLLWVAVLSTAAQNVNDLQLQQQQIEAELKQTQKMLKETKQNEKATENKLGLINQDIRNRKRLINSINNEITALDRDIVQLGERRGQLQTELERLKADYARLIRESHYADIKQTPLMFLLSSSNFRQLTRRIRYMYEFQQYRKQQVAQIERKQADIDTNTQQLNARRQDRNKALKTQEREKENLARTERKQQKMLQDLKAKEKNLAAKQKKQQKKMDELNRKIEEAIKKQAKTKTSLTKEQKLVAGGFEANKGKLPWPVEKGFISGHFGKHQHEVHEHVTINNKGIFLQTTAGSDARSVYEGEVSACMVRGTTYAVIIMHGNYRSVYCNLSKLYVKEGDKVKTKQAIGRIYTDGDNDNKTELYFQIYKDLTLLNPSLWLAQ